jgi:hypothetical protein
LVIRPWIDELAALGMNAMRHFDRTAITDASRNGAERLLEQNEDHPVIRSFKRTDEKEKVG